MVISGLGKLAETNQDVFHERIIQTTAPINPGNSGGPLMDSADQSIVTALHATGRVIRPWLDVKGKFVTEERRNLMALPVFS